MWESNQIESEIAASEEIARRAATSCPTCGGAIHWEDFLGAWIHSSDESGTDQHNVYEDEDPRAVAPKGEV
jgi:hypothetical protein